jgi:hypothetical protein
MPEDAMHFSLFVFLPPHEAVNRETIQEALERRLWPYSEDLEVAPYDEPCDECNPDSPDPQCEICEGKGYLTTTINPDAKWDWWRIGGRFTGDLVTDYDPETDPANLEICPACIGPRARYETAQCVNCNGTGISAKDYPEWREFERDILLAAEVRRDALTYALLTPDGVWQERDHRPYWEEDPAIVRAVRAALEQYADHTVALVDCHI